MFEVLATLFIADWIGPLGGLALLAWLGVVGLLDLCAAPDARSEEQKREEQIQAYLDLLPKDLRGNLYPGGEKALARFIKELEKKKAGGVNLRP